MPPSNAALAKLSIPEVLTKMMFEGDKVNPNWFTKGTPGCALDSLNLAAATPPPAFPPELGSLTELVLLSIRDGAGLVALLRTLRVLRSLKRLRIATCALAELPEELGTLANLEALELSHNKTLKTLPASLGKLPLRTLVVEGNAIAKLPKGLDLDRIAELTFAEPALRTKR